VPARPGQPLQEAGGDLHALDGWRRAPGDVQEREEACVGKAAAEHFKALLAAPHPSEPVVDQCDLHGLNRLLSTSKAMPFSRRRYGGEGSSHNSRAEVKRR
jgi:hypothetical protein